MSMQLTKPPPPLTTTTTSAAIRAQVAVPWDCGLRQSAPSLLAARCWDVSLSLYLN